MSNTVPDTGVVDKFYSHKLDDLLGLAGLRDALAVDAKNSLDLSAAWSVATKWTEASKYAVWDQFAAQEILDAVGHPLHGVLQWLKKHW